VCLLHALPVPRFEPALLCDTNHNRPLTYQNPSFSSPCLSLLVLCRPFGVLLDGVSAGWRYQPVDWPDVTRRGFIKALQVGGNGHMGHTGLSVRRGAVTDPAPEPLSAWKEPVGPARKLMHGFISNCWCSLDSWRCLCAVESEAVPWSVCFNGNCNSFASVSMHHWFPPPPPPIETLLPGILSADAMTSPPSLTLYHAIVLLEPLHSSSNSSSRQHFNSCQ
jgi:hypothetical protein